MATRILRLPEVKTRTGLSRSTIYVRLDKKIFPLPVPLGGRAVGWVETEIEAWIEAHIQSRRSQEA
jgi:prophage regulatory protein